jgi:hypothetical protein
MQTDIAYGDYMNAEADINRLQNLNQNIQSYREALQEAQKSKQVAGDQYLAAINASRKSAGQEPFTGYPEEAMGTRRVMPAVDRMGAPLTPDEEDMLRHTPPRRAVPVSPEEMTPARDARFMQNAGEIAPASYLEASEEGSVPTNPSRVQFLGGRMEGQPEAPKQPKATKKSDFTQVSNEKQPAKQPTPLERYNDLISKGEVGEANELKYNLEKQTFDRNMAKINAAYVQVLNTQGAAEADRFRDGYAKIAKEKFQAKPVEETEAFKTAQVYVNRAGFHQNRSSVAMLGEELAFAKKMIQDGKSKEAVIQALSANIPKLIQSLATGQSDAVQEAEARRLMPELTTILGQGFDLNAALKLASQKEASKWFTTQPQDFIKKAEKIFSAAVRVQNQSAAQYRKQIGSRAAESILLTELPEKVEPGGGNELSQYRQRLAVMNPSPQQGQPQQPPVQSKIGTAGPTVSPGSFWRFDTDSFGR